MTSIYITFVLAENNEKISEDSHSIEQEIPASLLDGARVCTLETVPNRTAGFAISGIDPAPFKICKVEKQSPAEKSGLKLNDILISINGKSVINSGYEETISLIKTELRKKTIQLLVKQSSEAKQRSGPSLGQSSVDGNSTIDFQGVSRSEANDSNQRGTNAIQQYQSMFEREKQNKPTIRS